MDNPKGPLKVVSLRVENFKRLEVVEITPESEIVRITGPNGAGKTCVLDAIEAAIGGARAEPELPIRQGESKAEIILDLGSIVIERRWHAGKPRQLVVLARDSDGAPEHKLTRPQQVLDELYSRVAMDPLMFYRLNAPQQLELLAELAGVTAALADLDDSYNKTYAVRAETNREIRRLDALCSNHVDADKPSERMDVAGIVEELHVRRTAQKQAWQDTQRLTRVLANVDNVNAAVAEAHQTLADAEKLLEARKDDVDDLQAALTIQYGNEIRAVSDIPVPTLEELESSLATAESVNRTYDEHVEREKLVARLGALRTSAELSTQNLKNVKQSKQSLVADATMPIDGIELGDDRPLWNGLPLSQASQADRVRVSAAVAMSQNRDIKVLLLRDASLLDTTSFSQICALAREHDCQVWMEQVDEDGEIGVYLEGGRVVSIDGVDSELPPMLEPSLGPDE